MSVDFAPYKAAWAVLRGSPQRLCRVHGALCPLLLQRLISPQVLPIDVVRLSCCGLLAVICLSFEQSAQMSAELSRRSRRLEHKEYSLAAIAESAATVL